MGQAEEDSGWAGVDMEPDVGIRDIDKPHLFSYNNSCLMDLV